MLLCFKQEFPFKAWPLHSLKWLYCAGTLWDFFLAFQVWLKFCDFWCGLCKACCSLQLCLVNLLVSWSLVIYSILDAGLLKTRPSELNVPQSSLKPSKKGSYFGLWVVHKLCSISFSSKFKSNQSLFGRSSKLQDKVEVLLSTNTRWQQQH